MALDKTIHRFNEQFDWDPVVANADALKQHRSYVIAGMGGSQLGPMLISAYGPSHRIISHRDYGLPELDPEVERGSLVILSSYSGTTEETLDAARTGLERKLPMAAISTGGALIDFARAHGLPHVVIPSTDLQPRLAIGFSMIGLARLMGESRLESRIREAGKSIEPTADRDLGLHTADLLQDKLIRVYASTANGALAYVWKIKLNESSKIPASWDVFPELCHNELTGMDVDDSTRELSADMAVVMLEDSQDHPRNKLRMRIVSDMFAERGIPVIRLPLPGQGFAKAFRSAVLADWVTFALAQYYGVPDEATPLIADLKKRLAAD